MSDLKSPRSKVLGGNKRTKAKPIVTPRIDATKSNNNNSNNKGAREDFNMNDEFNNEKGNTSSSRKSLFNLRSRGNKPKGEQRIGELPNKNQLQAQTKIQPMDPTDIVQIGGESLVLSSNTGSASTKKQQSRTPQQQLVPPESPSAVNNNSIASFSSKRATVSSPSKSFGTIGGGGSGLQRSFGNFFGGSSRNIMEPQQLVEFEDDEDGVSVSSDPLSQSRSSTLPSTAFESMFPGAPALPTTRATKPSITTKTTTPTPTKTPATPSHRDRLFSPEASVASSSIGTASSGPDAVPKSAAQLFEGDLNWIPIVRQTGLAAAPFAADDEDSRSVSSDQSEMRGPQARKQQDKKNKQQQHQKHEPTKEEIVAAEMAAQLAALRKSAEKLQKRYHGADEDPLPLESAHNPDAATAKLQKESSEWHEATGPAERKHTQEHLKDRDNIESEPVRQRRDKRSNRREGRNTNNSPTIPTLSEMLPAPEPMPIEVELDSSSSSMPSLANYSTSSMAADAFSKQYVVATTTDAKQHNRDDPSSKKSKRRNQPAVSELAQSATRSAHSAESSYMDESSELLSVEEPLSNTNGPDWLTTVRQQPQTNVYRDASSRDEQEPSAKKSPRKKGTGGKTTTGLDETLLANRSKFETLSTSILSGNSTLGGSSHMEDAPSVPFTSSSSSSSMLRHPQSMGNDHEDDDDIPKPKSWIQQPQIAKAEAAAVEEEVPEADSAPWKKVEEDAAATAIFSSVNPRPYTSNDDDDDDDDDDNNNNPTASSSPKRRRSRRLVGAATSKGKTEEDEEEVSEQPLTTEKEWHSTWTRVPTEGNDTYFEKDKSPRRSKSPKSKKSSKISKQLHVQSDKEIGESSVPMESEEAWHGVPVLPRTANEQESDDEEREKSIVTGMGKTPKTRNRKDRKKPQESREVSSKEVSTRPRSRRGRSKSADQNDVETQPTTRTENHTVDDEDIDDVVLRDGEGFHSVVLDRESIEYNGEYHQETLPLSFPNQSTSDHYVDGDFYSDDIKDVAMRTFEVDQAFYSIQAQSNTSLDIILHDQGPLVASAGERGMSSIARKGHTKDEGDVYQESSQSSGKAVKNPEWHGLTIKHTVNEVDNSHTVGEGYLPNTAAKKHKGEPMSYHGLNETENAALADIDALEDEQSGMVPFEMQIQARSAYPYQSDVEIGVGTSDSLVSPNEHQISTGEMPEDLGIQDDIAGIENEAIRRMGAGANGDGPLESEDAELPEAMPVISYVDSDSDDSSSLNAGLLGLENPRQGQLGPSPKSERAEPEKTQSKNFFGDEVPEATNFFGERVEDKVQAGAQKVKPESSFVRPPRPPADDKSSLVVMSPPPKEKLSVASSTPNSPSDDLTIQSVDRGLGDLSRLNKLHEKVSRRREVLTSMLEASKNKSLTVENELLDLKRKLAISQALVQDLEIENDQIRRQNVLDGARIQTTLLENLHKREIELENQVKSVMKQRNAAVEENHGLRMIMMAGCASCRNRIPEKKFVMDYSIRDTILERRKPRSSFAWMTGNLSAEAQVSMEESHQSLRVDNANHVAEKVHFNDALGNNGHDSMETGSLATTLPDSGSVFTSNLPVFTEAPLLWLSEKIFQRNEKKKKGDDLPLLEEVITFKRNATPRVRNVTVGDGDPAKSFGEDTGVFPSATASEGKKKHLTKKKTTAEDTRVIPSMPASPSKQKKNKGKKKKTNDEGIDESFSSCSSKGSAKDGGVIPLTIESASKPKKKKSKKKKSSIEGLDESLSSCSSQASAEDSGVIPSTTDLAFMPKKKKSKKKKASGEGLDDESCSSYISNDNEELTGDIPSPSTFKPKKKKPKKKEKKDEGLEESFSSCSSIEGAGDGPKAKGRKTKKPQEKAVRKSHLTGSSASYTGGLYGASEYQEDKQVSSRGAPAKQPIKDPWSGPMETSVKPGSSNGYGENSTRNREQTGKQESAKVPVNEKKKSTFFGSLMGEQVLDEFASFGFPSSNPDKNIAEKKTPPKIFSFFGSLMAEQVDDDAPFITAKSSSKTPTIPEAVAAEKPEIRKSRLRALLQEERVEDDMLVLRDVVPGASTSERGAQSSKFPATTERLRREGLKERTPRLETQTGEPASPQKMTFLGWSRDRLNRERVEDDMSFLKSPQVSPTRSMIGRSLGANSKTGDETREEMSPIKPVLSSILEPGFSSPLSKNGPVSPRRKRSGTNRGRRGSTRESPVPTYLNKFRSSVVIGSSLPEGVTEGMADARNSPVNDDLGDTSSDFPDDRSPLGKRASSMGFGSLDADLLGSRPWRSDTGVRKLTSKLAIQVEGESESPFDLGSDNESIGEYDPLKAAMALQDDPLGALDAIDNKKSERHSVGLGGDPLSALDALPGDMLNYSARESRGLDEDPLSYLDALAGGNSYSPGIDDELGDIGLLPL